MLCDAEFGGCPLYFSRLLDIRLVNVRHCPTWTLFSAVPLMAAKIGKAFNLYILHDFDGS